MTAIILFNIIVISYYSVEISEVFNINTIQCTCKYNFQSCKNTCFKCFKCKLYTNISTQNNTVYDNVFIVINVYTNKLFSNNEFRAKNPHYNN